MKESQKTTLSPNKITLKKMKNLQSSCRKAALLSREHLANFYYMENASIQSYLFAQPKFTMQFVNLAAYGSPKTSFCWYFWFIFLNRYLFIACTFICRTKITTATRVRRKNNNLFHYDVKCMLFHIIPFTLNSNNTHKHKI